ncbi:MAG: succinylglutamate desuccinylase/aspartoacylase family protein [Bdellovibrionota bacterium]
MPNPSYIEESIAEVDGLLLRLAKNNIGSLSLESITDRAFLLNPQERRPTDHRRKIDLTIQCLTHGNEVGGVFVVSELIRLLEQRLLEPKINICLTLGNLEALRAGKRFLESDLNRSFGLERHTNPEEKLALGLEEIYRQTFALIDLHQTQGPSAEPFFISKFDPRSFRLMRTCLPRTAVVTYFEKSFAQGQMTTVNYHLLHGGIGFGLELGEKGIQAGQIELGLSAIIKAIAALENLARGKVWPSLPPQYAEQVYTFHETQRTQTGEFNLVPGLSNMKSIKKDTVLGEIDGSSYRAPFDGKVLFPVYKDQGALGRPNMDVLRYIRPLTRDELDSHLNGS